MKRAILMLVLFLGGCSQQATPSLRTWTDTSGMFSIRAKFVSVEKQIVKIEDAAGQTYDVPIHRLCEKDQKYLQTKGYQAELLGAIHEGHSGGNPFASRQASQEAPKPATPAPASPPSTAAILAALNEHLPQPLGPSLADRTGRLLGQGIASLVKTRPQVPPTYTVELPSGVSITEKMFAIASGWQSTGFPLGTSVYVTKHPRGQIAGIYTHKNAGIADGPAAALYDTGELHWLAVFTHGLPNGSMRILDRSKRVVFYASYLDGRKHGIACYFQWGWPSVIQEWEKGACKAVHVLRRGRIQQSIESVDAGMLSDELKRAAQSSPELQLALDEMDRLEDEVKTEYDAAKRGLYQWYKAQKADARPSIKRASPERIAPYDPAIGAQVVGDDWRAALSRCGR